jgi:hypothetical protein
MTTGAMRCWAGRHGGKRCVERYEPLVARPSRSGMAVVAMHAHMLSSERARAGFAAASL